MNIVYKASLKLFLLNLFGVIILVLIIMIFAGKMDTIILTTIGIVILYLTSLFFKKRLVKLTIDKKESIIYFNFNSYLFLNTQEKYKIEDINYSFDLEIGPRGGNRKVFIIKLKNENLIKIIPNIDGWSELKLNQIINNIK
jgi:hypothetical protein